MAEEKRIYLSIPHLGTNERLYVNKAFDDNWVSTVGENIDELERAIKESFGINAVALSSGTAAIHLGLKGLGLQYGDEVVVPTLTFVAGANPVLYEGANPIFIDSESQSWNLDPNVLGDFLKNRAKFNRLPKIITVAHLFGQSANLGPIKELCSQYEIPLLEDAAESIGTKYNGNQTGTVGDIGVFSFNGNKMITASAGGVFLSHDPQLCGLVRKWSTQARDEDTERVNNYYHSQIGYNYRMSNVLAGIARGQMEILDLRISQRRKVFNHYQDAFSSISGIQGQAEASWGQHSRWLSCFTIDPSKFGQSAYDLIRYLESHNIESRPVWKPLHQHKLFARYEYFGGNVAEDLNLNGICLPSSSSLTEEEQQRVIDAVIKFHNKRKRI